MTIKRIAKSWRGFSLSKEPSYGSPQTVDTALDFQGPLTTVSGAETSSDRSTISGLSGAASEEVLHWQVDGHHRHFADTHNVALFGALVLGKVVSQQPDPVNDPNWYRHYIEHKMETHELPSVTLVESDGANAKKFPGIFGKSLKVTGCAGETLQMEAHFGGRGTESPSAIASPPGVSESPLRFADVDLQLGGTLTGSVNFGDLVLSGSPLILRDTLAGFDFTLSNESRTIYEMGDTSGTVSRVERGDRWNTELKILFNRIDTSHEDRFLSGAVNPLLLTAVGSPLPGSTGTPRYQIKIYFPKTIYRETVIGLNGQIIRVEANLGILEDPGYGSVIVEIHNNIPSYPGL